MNCLIAQSTTYSGAQPIVSLPKVLAYSLRKVAHLPLCETLFRFISFPQNSPVMMPDYFTTFGFNLFGSADIALNVRAEVLVLRSS